MNKSEMQDYLRTAVATAGYEVRKVEYFPYAFNDFIGKMARFSRAVALQVKKLGGDQSNHVVVLAYSKTATGDDDYVFWCGDQFLEGTGYGTAWNTPDDRCLEALGEIGKRKDAGLLGELLGMYGNFEKSNGCNFWAKWKGSKEPCKHVNQALHYLLRSDPDVLDNLAAAYDGDLGVTEPVAVSKPGVGVFERYAFKVPMLLEGDRGSGKTFEVRAYSKTHSLPLIEVGGHEGIEASDLLGYYVPNGKGGLTWKDGAVAEAFRKAQAGKTMLLVDELLRIPQRELSVLLSALSPFDGEYKLRTGRILQEVDGVACEETLTCPVTNLFVTATTNVGAEFAVDNLDPALAERFIIIRKDTDVDKLREIVEAAVAAKGLAASLGKALVEFFTKMLELKKQGVLNRAPTQRTISRALELGEDEADVMEALRAQMLLWVDRDVDGVPVAEQMADIERVLARVFKPVLSKNPAEKSAKATSTASAKAAGSSGTSASAKAPGTGKRTRATKKAGSSAGELKPSHVSESWAVVAEAVINGFGSEHWE